MTKFRRSSSGIYVPNTPAKTPNCNSCGENIPYFTKERKEALTTNNGVPICAQCKIKRQMSGRLDQGKREYERDKKSKDKREDAQERKRIREVAHRSQQSDDVNSIEDMDNVDKKSFNV